MSSSIKPGWHERGYIPHFDANTLLQHVVFRTKDSLSRSLLEHLQLKDGVAQRSIIDNALDYSNAGRTFSDPNFADIMQD